MIFFNLRLTPATAGQVEYLGVVVGVGLVLGLGLGLLHGLGARGPQVDGEVDELRVLLDERADGVRLQVVRRLLLDVQAAGGVQGILLLMIFLFF